MVFEELQIKNFRNFIDLRLDLRERLNFFVGENGQGKTNLIEALYLLCRGQSFRPVDPSSLVRKARTDSGVASLHAKINERNLKFDVQMRFDAGRKTTFLNGKSVSSFQLTERFPVVLFSPESLVAIKEGPEERRLLIDDLVLTHNSNHAGLLREYSRCLRARNQILRDLREGIHINENRQTLESLNSIFLVLGTQLTTTRMQSLHAILDDLQDAWHMIQSGCDGGLIGDISVDYLISDQNGWDWSESKVYDAMSKRLSELATAEVHSGGSLVGPHKHDIRFLFAGNDSRFFCSQGQQRALIIAFKIAQIVYHHRVHQTFPLLLLDDVMSELDKAKRINLMTFLEGISAQVLITSTDLIWSEQFSFERNSVFQVRSGQMRPRDLIDSSTDLEP